MDICLSWLYAQCSVIVLAQQGYLFEILSVLMKPNRHGAGWRLQNTSLGSAFLERCLKFLHPDLDRRTRGIIMAAWEWGGGWLSIME